MRDNLQPGIPDTAPYKEWLGIVGSMMAAVLICAVLFSAGVLT
jgi:CDP-diglyceride synthetase